MSCPLCRPIEKKTKWYYEDEKISIFECIHHKIPQWVWHEHKAQLAEEEIEYGRSKCRESFGSNISFRGPKSILVHYHEHVIKGEG